jgi:signal transduction histidine kinase
MIFNFPLSIKTQLVFAFMTICTIIIIVVSYFNFISNVDQEKNSFIQNSEIQANLIADFSISPLVFLDMEGAEENLNKLKSDKNILKVIIFDNSDSIFAQYNPHNIPTAKNIELSAGTKIDKNSGFINFGNLIITVPLKHKDEVYGTLYIEKSTQLVTNLIKKVFNDIVLFAISLLLVIYVISVFISNYFLRPILSLAKSAEKIANSRNYNTRVEYNGKNEIGTLYKAFNNLLKDTEELTNNLEEKVQSRTSKLNKSLEDLKMTQQQLIESEKMSALGNLVSGIAHEINTPLGNAITTSSIIEKEATLILKDFNDGNLKKSTLEHKLDILNQSARLLNKTLNYASNLIKSFKQISIDQVTNDIRTFEIKTYIEDVFLTNHNILKQLPVEVEIIANDEINIRTSPGVIAQIFNNLIQNSVIHGFENFDRKAKISVFLVQKDDQVFIKYHDNGHGINYEIKNTIFEPFVTTKRNNGGTGLGLNIVYNLIAQKLKGTIKLEIEERIGTTFMISIPLVYSQKEDK